MQSVAERAAPLSPLARMRISADLAGLVKQKHTLVAGPTAGLQAARLASQIIQLLRRLGVENGGRKVGAASGDAAPEPRRPTAHLYHYDPDRKPAQRRKDNAAATDLLRIIDKGEVDGAALTDAQREILARYSGSGGNLIDSATGLKGSAYEYFTPKPIAAQMWSLLEEMGFTGGKALDPCGGVGIFGATAPASVAVEAVELSETSGRINQLVNAGPGYSAIVSPFEAVASRTDDEIYDAVISNVPFGTVHDRGGNRKLDQRYQDQPLESYFILRSLEKLRPGGLAAFIVPPRVVSGKGGREEQLRVSASYMAEFCGAYRLPNSVFGAADADTITDVIVLRKFGRDALDKIAEVKEQDPALLVTAKVQWTEFISGDYFRGEGRRFVLGEFQAKDPAKFRDVDRVITSSSVADIAKLLRKFPDSRIDWAMLDAAETQPNVYQDGDTMTLAGQTLEMRQGGWVSLGAAFGVERFDGLGQQLTSPSVAVANRVTWAQAAEYVGYLRSRSLELDLPDWLRAASKDVLTLDTADRAKFWAALTTGLATVEVMGRHAHDVGFNYVEEYPAVTEALAAVASSARRGPSKFSRESKAALVKVGIVYDRRAGYSDVWKGLVQADVAEGLEVTADGQVEAAKYQAQGIAIETGALKAIYGAEFDPMTDDAWCLNAVGTKAIKADDYFSGNLGAFLARIDGEIAAASGPLRAKLIRQKTIARDRIELVDPAELRYNLFSPFVTLEEKAEFLRRFLHPAFVVGVNDEGEKVILCDITKVTNERERQLKRFAEYLKKGNLSTRTAEDEARSNPLLEDQRRKMLRDMAATTAAQFDQWVKSNPNIMGRMQALANDPARMYFTEVDDASALQIPGIHPDFNLHGYQNSYVRKMGRAFAGINGFAGGLGKTATALAAVAYVQGIGVKKKTIFVVPNSVLSKWRVEAVVGRGRPGDAKYRAPVLASGAGCLFVGLDVDVMGDASVDSKNYARDFTRILENRHGMIFCTMEAFKMIPLKNSTMEAYSRHLAAVDPSYSAGDRAAEVERAESKLAEATSGTGAKSTAIPFFEDMGIDSIVMDEAHCFPAGTLVDGVPIERLQTGDMVWSFNHSSGRLELRAVTATMSRKAGEMVRVHLADGRAISCTPNHPFYSENDGYVCAEFLNSGDVVYVTTSGTQPHGPNQVRSLPADLRGLGRSEAQTGCGAEGLLHQAVLRQGADNQGANPEVMLQLPESVRVRPCAELEGGDLQGRSVLLRQQLQISGSAQDLGSDAGVERQRRQEGGGARHTSTPQPPPNPRSSGEEPNEATGQWCAQGPEDCAAGRQWPTPPSRSGGAGCTVAVANRTFDTDVHASGERLSRGIQAGFGQRCDQAGRRDRREFPSLKGGESQGSEEGGPLGRVRVDRVEVLEPGRDGSFGGVCPGGVVYDITVDGNHNFFAEGILVHNCYKNSKNTIEFSSAKFLSAAEASQRGLDVQTKAWFVRQLGPLEDGVLALTATPITNSPLEIYSMLCLAVGEQKVHDLTMGARGADQFMEVMCDVVDDEEVSIDGLVKPYRVFRGLQNVNLLRNALGAVATIKTGEDVKAAGDDLRLPGSPEFKQSIRLTDEAAAALHEYKLAYRGARAATGAAGKNAEPPTPEELDAMMRVAEKFGEPLELIAHPFNLINKMSMVIADPELDSRASFYRVGAGSDDDVQAVIDAFNKLGKIEVRRRPGPWTAPEAVVGSKIIKDGDSQVSMVRIRVEAKFAPDGRVVVDTLDTNNQALFERLADKAGLDLDVSIPPKLAALLENVRREEATPRGGPHVKQIIFCDILPLHNKIRRLLIKRAGIPAAAIALVSGQAIKGAEQMQDVQDGFNAMGADNKHRTIIANEKAEVGVDLQVGTQAVHHLTTGWTPDSMAQRNWRAVRQGNTVDFVNLYQYDADGTFDEYKRNLTSKKGDWIGAVMDRQGGNDVAVAGGLTNDQYDELIESIGDAGAIEAVRHRAVVRERQARTDTARARQVINLKTAMAQRAFTVRYPDARSWAAAKAMELYDLRLSIKAMESRAQRKMSAASQIKLETRIAELRAQAAALTAQIDASATFTRQYYNLSDRGATDMGVLAYLDRGTGYTAAAKVREQITSGLMREMKVKDGSELEQDWQSEAAAAEQMAAQALKDFERIAAGPDGGHPAELAQAFRDDQVTFIGDQVVARGMFVRLPKEGLCVVQDKTTIIRFPSSYVAYTSVIGNAGVKLIPFGTPEYEQALTEAAALDDAAEGVTLHNTPTLFSSIVPAVGLRRQKETLLTWSNQDIMLPAPLFPYAVNPDDERLSAAARALGEPQRAIIQEWRDGEVMVSASAKIITDRGRATHSNARVRAMADLAKANGQPFTLTDYTVIGCGSAAAYQTNAARDLLRSIAGVKPGMPEAVMAAADETAIDELITRFTQELYAGWLELPPEAPAAGFTPIGLTAAGNSRKHDLVRAREASAREAVRLAAMAAREEEAAAAPAPVAAPAEEAPAPVLPMPKDIRPNARGKVGIQGDTKTHKDAIKDSSRAVGVAPYWNGKAVMWEVPPAAWNHLMEHYPDAARALYLVQA